MKKRIPMIMATESAVRSGVSKGVDFGDSFIIPINDDCHIEQIKSQVIKAKKNK